MLYQTADPENIFLAVIALIAAVVFVVMLALLARLVSANRTIREDEAGNEPAADHGGVSVNFPVEDTEAVFRAPASTISPAAGFLAGALVGTAIGWIASRVIKN